MHIRGKGHRVTGRSLKDITSLSQSVRDQLSLTAAYVNIVSLFEVLQDMEILEFEIVPDGTLDGEEARTYPDRGEILITQSVYDLACDDDGHCRFTLAHELGHLFMHKGQSSYARASKGQHKIYEDSEWQADTFASEFLADQRIMGKCDDPSWVSETFGISHSASETRIRKNKQKNRD